MFKFKSAIRSAGFAAEQTTKMQKRKWSCIGVTFLYLTVIVVVESPSHVQHFATPWTAACQDSLSLTISQHLPSSRPLCWWYQPAVLSSDALFPPTLNLSQHQGLYQWVSSSHQMTKFWSFSFCISPSNVYSELISLTIDWLDLLAAQGAFRSPPAPHFKGINSLAFCLLYSPALAVICDHWEDLSLDYVNLCRQSNVSAFQHTV